MVAEKRDLAATRRFFTRALEHGPSPTEVTTDRAAAYPRVLEELVPAACHVTERYANNAIEVDHAQLKSCLRSMRGLKQLRCARVICAEHAFVQNIRRGHYESNEPTGPGCLRRAGPGDLTINDFACPAFAQRNSPAKRYSSNARSQRQGWPTSPVATVRTDGSAETTSTRW